MIEKDKRWFGEAVKIVLKITSQKHSFNVQQIRKMKLVSEQFSLRSEYPIKGNSPVIQHTNYTWAMGDRQM